MIKWFRKDAVPSPAISEDEIQILREKTKALKEKVKEMERSVMDGESQWMLVKCPQNYTPVCKPELKTKGNNLCAT